MSTLAMSSTNLSEGVINLVDLTQLVLARNPFLHPKVMTIASQLEVEGPPVDSSSSETSTSNVGYVWREVKSLLGFSGLWHSGDLTDYFQTWVAKTELKQYIVVPFLVL